MCKFKIHSLLIFSAIIIKALSLPIKDLKDIISDNRDIFSPDIISLMERHAEMIKSINDDIFFNEFNDLYSNSESDKENTDVEEIEIDLKEYNSSKDGGIKDNILNIIKSFMGFDFNKNNDFIIKKISISSNSKSEDPISNTKHEIIEIESSEYESDTKKMDNKKDNLLVLQM